MAQAYVQSFTKLQHRRMHIDALSQALDSIDNIPSDLIPTKIEIKAALYGYISLISSITEKSIDLLKRNAERLSDEEMKQLCSGFKFDFAAEMQNLLRDIDNIQQEYTTSGEPEKDEQKTLQDHRGAGSPIDLETQNQTFQENEIEQISPSNEHPNFSSETLKLKFNIKENQGQRNTSPVRKDIETSGNNSSDEETDDNTTESQSRKSKHSKIPKSPTENQKQKGPSLTNSDSNSNSYSESDSGNSNNEGTEHSSNKKQKRMQMNDDGDIFITVEKNVKGELYYKCFSTNCAKGYASKDSLHKHIKKHHQLRTPRNTLKCQICLDEFPSQKSLNTHYSVHIIEKY